MKEHKFREYIYMGVTAVLVIVACIACVFIFLKWGAVKAGLRTLSGILAPITYGAILAYLLTPVYNRVVKWSKKITDRYWKDKSGGEGIAKGVGTLVSLALLCFIVVGLISMVLPQVLNSIIGVINALPGNAEKLSLWIQTVFANNPEVEKTVLDLYTQAVDKVIAWSTTDLIPNLEKVISGVFCGVISVVNLVMDALIGIVVMVYLLNIKGKLCAQAKKSIYGFFPLGIANEIIEKFRFIHQVFGGFIIGKILDSVIIGLLCFLCLSVMKMPYVLLISVIIGVTNVIPFFGPFIGAIPSSILILMINPIQCLYFLIFIFLLQQFDGNILGPKILGESTGLSSFWVLFSILLFGGLLGFVGMIIAVPTFAVIYRLVSERVTVLLKKRNLNTDTDIYQNLDHIEEEGYIYVPLVVEAEHKECEGADEGKN